MTELEIQWAALVRLFVVLALPFVALSIYFGVRGYYTPVQPFENYLATLPPGLKSHFDTFTYFLYFQYSFLVQVFFGLGALPVMVYAFLKPMEFLGVFDTVMQKILGPDSNDFED